MPIADPFELPAEVLARCAEEPIHAPEAIQPFGQLLVLDPSGKIRRAAGVSFHPGQSLADLWPAEAARAAVAVSAEEYVAGCGTFALPDRGWCEVRAHRSGDNILVEAIPCDEPSRTSDQRDAAVRALGDLAARAAFDGAATDFAGATAAYLRESTGYDRVMVYRFGADWSGEVVAEDAAVVRYLGMWFSSSDIPPQARALHLRARIRALADVNADAVPLVPAAPSGKAVDLSLCLTRAMSPVHRMFLSNMGVRSTLVASVVVEGQLWGLIACHHRLPRVPSSEVRSLIGVAAELLAARVALARSREAAEGAARAQDAFAALSRLDVADGTWISRVLQPEGRLMEAMGADGLVIAARGAARSRGMALETPQLESLLEWLGRQPGTVVATDQVRAAAPALAHFGPTCGVLAVRPVGFEGTWLIWLRGEWAHTVAWGGDPRRGLIEAGGTLKLLPRESFAAWVQEVAGRARPWSQIELAFADEVARSNMLAWLLEQDERKRASAALRASLAEKETLLREVHHRVKNNLAVVDDLLGLQARRLTDAGASAALRESQNRVRSMAVIHQLLYQSDRFGGVEVGAYVERLVGTLASTYLSNPRRVELRTRADELVLDLDRAVPFGLILTELVSNAFKHAFPLERAGTLAVAVEVRNGEVALTVADDGPGFPPGSDLLRSPALGGRLVRALVQQLTGRCEARTDGGAVVTVRFAESSAEVTP